MRWVSFLFVLGCLGGQTGEITEPTTCDEVGEILAPDELDAEERRGVSNAGAPWEGTLTWDPGSWDMIGATGLRLSAVMRDDAIERRGFGGCVHLVVPVDLTLSTDDGRLAETFEGELELRDVGGVVMRGTIAVDAIAGSLDLEVLGPMPEGRLYLELNREDDRSNGQLFVRPSAEEDEIRLGAW